MTSARQQIVAALRDKQYRDAFVAAGINRGLPYQIRMTRKQRGWTQADLAARTGQQQATISQLENPNYGRHSLGTLKRLASAFDTGLLVAFVPFSALVSWSLAEPVDVSADQLVLPGFGDDPGLREGPG